MLRVLDFLTESVRCLRLGVGLLVTGAAASLSLVEPMAGVAWPNFAPLPKLGLDVLPTVPADRSFAPMELPMRRVLPGGIRLPGLAERGADALGLLIELPILSLFSVPKCLPGLAAGGFAGAGADGLVVLIGLAMLRALLEPTCLLVLTSDEFCLPIGLAIREVLVKLELAFVFATGDLA